jgi:peptidoglycan/LPS O-acetylase OafA/YrhL
MPIFATTVAACPGCRRYASGASGAVEISYTLYLTHFPLLILVIMIGFAPYRFPSSSTGAVIYLGLFILAIQWAVTFWWCFERHTDRIFHCVTARLLLRAVGTPPPSAASPI